MRPKRRKQPYFRGTGYYVMRVVMRVNFLETNLKTKNPDNYLIIRVLYCGPTWNRTKHLLIMSQLL